ncbi:PadR family transcriptional regulator [Streptomyces sp. NL15-2K]|uniref:PadR family transcriptional regulator n=1 Tax=Streptomyces sp. NL15-2K TaxID=376149 RepID=UPI000F563F0A|nr:MULTISPECIES: PadR family transcriptional regulator [Actinomycetes]WKX11124.1 PadR family transcriptional regulator [Kutzneria buriramensis]GCB47446.1 padR family transcriptional regulator [Streptomyces sp. NL15-2K]
MLELAILGHLAEAPLHGYELRRRVDRLSGYTRPVSEGSLYPAIKRLVNRGLLTRHTEPGTAAAQRYVLTLTDAGRAELLQRLRNPAQHEITDFTRFFTILAFLSLLPDKEEQHAVLRRRLEFLETPSSFFYDDDRPLRAEEVADPYRRGMLLTARAITRAECAWLHGVLDGDQDSDIPQQSAGKQQI